MKVLTQGSFDVFHQGHANFLSRCERFGGLYVGVLTDESYEEYRGYKPEDDLETRIRNIKMRFKWATIFKTTPWQMGHDIIKYYPDIIAIGSDWVEKDIYEQWDVRPGSIDDKLVYIPYTQGISSTQIKKVMK